MDQDSIVLAGIQTQSPEVTALQRLSAFAVLCFVSEITEWLPVVH